jgi:hypothetical protein
MIHALAVVATIANGSAVATEASSEFTPTPTPTLPYEEEEERQRAAVLHWSLK